MSAEHNEALARELWQTTSRGDAEGLRAVLDEKVRWRAASAGVFTGEVAGPDAVILLLAESGEMVDDLRSDLLDVFSSPDGAVLYYRVEARRDDRQLSTELLLRLRCEGGLIVEMSTCPFDAAANDAFWS